MSLLSVTVVGVAVGEVAPLRPPTRRRRRGAEGGGGLLPEVFLVLGGLVVLLGLLVLEGGAERRLQEFAGGQAVAAGVALGVDDGLALGRDGDFDDAHG